MIEGKYLERICGELIFVFFAFIICIYIYKSNNYKKTRNILFVYVIVLSILSYLFRPFCAIDLTNLQGYLEPYYSHLTWKQMFNNMISVPDFARYFYFFIIAKIGNPNLLQTFVTTLVYAIIFYTIYDYSKLKKYNTQMIAKVVFLFMMCGQYIDLISGIRSTTAFAIFYFCIYREFFQNKSIISNIPLYLLSFGFHIAVIPAIGVRFFFLLFQKEKNIFKKIFNFIIFILIIIISLRYGNSILEATSSKANIYLNQSIYSSVNGYIISSLTFIILIYLFILNKESIKGDKMKDRSDINYLRLSIFYFGIILLFCSEYSIFHRYVILLSMIMLPLSANAFNYISIKMIDTNECCKRIVISKYEFIYIILLLLMSFCSFTMGDMKLLQFFN